VVNCGPSGEGLPEDQCIFVRGFRVARKFMILPRLRAAAGPNPDLEGCDEEPDDVELIPIPASPKYRDPLRILLELIAEKAPNCDMVLVRDDDLSQLAGIHDWEDTPLESLQLDALLSQLRISEPKIHDIPSEPETVSVATLSTVFNELAIVGKKSHSQPQHGVMHSRSFDTSSPKVFDTTEFPGPSLLVDGYVSRTFQPRRAAQYFLNLLKRDSLPSVEASSLPYRESHFFVVGPITQDVPRQPEGFDTSSRPLDRAIVGRGSVVPQTMWSPHTATEKRLQVEEAVLQMPIFFESVEGILGISLEDVASGRCDALRGAEEYAPLGGKTTTHIRIWWPGYKVFKRQVQIRDETSERNPITISKFAHHIGRSVDAFLKACEPDPRCTDIRHQLWQIGGPGDIQPERSGIIVIGAIHVAAGSWMPILQLNRYLV